MNTRLISSTGYVITYLEPSGAIIQRIKKIITEELMNNIRKLSMRNVINDRNVKNTKFTNSLVK
jgi:hypothetical protein